MNGRTLAMGTMLLMLLGGCAGQSDYVVSAMVRGDEVRTEMTRIKVDLAEIVTP